MTVWRHGDIPDILVLINILASVNYLGGLTLLCFSGAAASLAYTPHSRWEEERPCAATLCSTEAFTATAKICREFLSTFLAGTVLDSLSEAARQVRHVTREWY